MKNREALQRMGYRIMTPGIWGKPFGYSLYIYKEDEHTLFFYIKGRQDVVLFSSQKHEYNKNDDFLDFIKYAEYSMYHSNYQNSSFDFLSPEQQIGEML